MLWIADRVEAILLVQFSCCTLAMLESWMCDILARSVTGALFFLSKDGFGVGGAG